MERGFERGGAHVPGGDPRGSGAGARAPEPAFSGVFSRTFLVTLVVSLIVLLVLRELLAPGPLLDPDAEARVVTPRGDLAADEISTIEIFESAAPSVVHITTTSIRPQRGFFTVRQVEVPEGTGTGFVWDDAGHVVTNYHVIRTADSAQVMLSDGSVYEAQLVGAAPDSDLAVVRIEAPPGRLKPIPVGTSADLKVGQKVFAIGNPFGLDQTLTTGVISGLDRVIVSETNLAIRGVIQTDAAINPGNSGGPLLDSAGRLIGVNTAIKSPTGAYAGIGFAVPVDTVNSIVPRILREGIASRAGLGVYLGQDEWAGANGLEGAVVQQVIPGGSADRAGLRGVRELGRGRYELGDVIVAIDGREVRGQDDVFRALESYAAGTRVTVTVTRFTGSEQRRVDVDVELQALR